MDKNDAKGNDLGGLGGSQPGSTMKPFTFAQWLNEGKSMNTVVNGCRAQVPAELPVEEHLPHHRDGRLQHGRRRPGRRHDLQNAEEDYYQPMTVLEGLYNSINTITFASAAQVDLCGIQKIVDAVGIHAGLTNEPRSNMITPVATCSAPPRPRR